MIVIDTDDTELWALLAGGGDLGRPATRDRSACRPAIVAGGGGLDRSAMRECAARRPAIVAGWRRPSVPRRGGARPTARRPADVAGQWRPAAQPALQAAAWTLPGFPWWTIPTCPTGFDVMRQTFWYKATYACVYHCENAIICASVEL